jgi:hypothetical protein
MSILDRFRKRENLSPLISVDFPKENPVIRFTVKRAPQSFLNVANIEATEKHKKDDEDSISFGWICYELTPLLCAHVTGWQALDGGELPPFNKENAKKLFDEFTIDERMIFGLCYMEAANADEKKNEPSTTTPSDS